MENYLIKQYGVIEDTELLQSESDIETYFYDYGDELLDCGVDYFQDEGEKICKIGDKFYRVHFVGEIESFPTDSMAELYIAEGISKVTYEEIDKPEKKKAYKYELTMELTDDELTMIKDFIEEEQLKLIEVKEDNTI